MIFESTSLTGVTIITPRKNEDYRGEFTEVYNEKSFAENGIKIAFIEDDVSVSAKNVLRGMHAYTETAKLISCLYGRVYTVVVNCDETSRDFGKWESFILSGENRKTLYVPPMFAHGYYTLSEISVYLYKQSKYFGGRQMNYAWNDPRFAIKWPSEYPILSEKDTLYPPR
jgi:dTDP-4-dehydrorhamnose 3,5-epimerase